MTSKERLFIGNAADTIKTSIQRIEYSESFGDAEEIENLTLGYIDCLFTFLYTVADEKTEKEVSKTIQSLVCGVYRAMSCAAIRFGETEETIQKFVKLVNANS